MFDRTPFHIAVAASAGAAGAVLAVFAVLGDRVDAVIAGAACGAGALAWITAMLAKRPADETPQETIIAPVAEQVRPSDRLMLDAIAALETAPAAILVVDGAQRLTFANAAAEALFGPAPIGEPIVNVVRAPELIEAVEDAITSRSAQSLDFDHMRSRDERALIAHIRPLESASKTSTPPPAPQAAALILVQDQTRSRRIERMRQDFIANASHELRTPLASISGFIETLQGPARDDAAARERFLAIMATQAERMKRLVDDLMSLNRIETNLHVRPSDQVDLFALAHEVAAAMEPVAAEWNAKLEILTPPSGLVVAGDRDQLAQLLTNLMDNALKYGGDGVHVRVVPATQAPEWPGMVGLTIADDGPGILREHLPRLTERFYRVSAKRSKEVGGTGLGLAIAKHILQRHRGDLSIRSAPGDGSEFTVRLPAGEDSNSPRQHFDNRQAVR